MKPTIEQLLNRAYLLILHQPPTAQRQTWIDDYLCWGAQKQRKITQLELWNGNPEPFDQNQRKPS